MVWSFVILFKNVFLHKIEISDSFIKKQFIYIFIAVYIVLKSLFVKIFIKRWYKTAHESFRLTCFYSLQP